MSAKPPPARDLSRHPARLGRLERREAATPTGPFAPGEASDVGSTTTSVWRRRAEVFAVRSL